MTPAGPRLSKQSSCRIVHADAGGTVTATSASADAKSRLPTRRPDAAVLRTRAYAVIVSRRGSRDARIPGRHPPTEFA